MINENVEEKSPKDKWYKQIQVVEACVNDMKTYYLIDENYNFIPLIKEYMDMLCARAEYILSPNTIRSYCNNFRYFIIFMKIHDLEFQDFDGQPCLLTNFKMWLKNPFRFYENIEMLNFNLDFEYSPDNLKTTTINAIIDRVSSLFTWLKASGRISENPIIYRRVAISNNVSNTRLLAHAMRNRSLEINTLKSKVTKSLPKIVDEEEFKLFLNSFNLLRDKIIVLVLKEGGLRAGELLGIHLEDIDFAEQGVWVRFRFNNENGSRAKAGYGRDRFVYLSSAIMSLIDTYISTEWIDSNPVSDFLFVVVKSNKHSENGSYMSKNTLDSLFNYHNIKVFGYSETNNKKKAKKSIRPHHLRHTHATELVLYYINRGESINWEYVSKRLGHKSVITTMSTYCHLQKKDYKKEYLRLLNQKKNM